MPLRAAKTQETNSKQQFVLLTSIKDPGIRFFNKTAAQKVPFGKASEDNGVDLFKSYLHPEDYPAYQVHLNALSEDEEKEITVRLKDLRGNWSSFCFRDRLYKGMPQRPGPMVLSFVQEIRSGTGIPQEGAPEKKNPDAQLVDIDYKHIVASLDDAFCIIELIFDENGEPVDFLFLKTNPAFETQIPYKNALGRTLREVNSAVVDPKFTYLKEVVQNGEPLRFQLFLKALDQSWFEIFACRIGEEPSSRLAMMFRNITQSKRTEEELKAAKEELEKSKAALEVKAARRKTALEESQELLQKVFDNSNQALAVFKTLYNEDGSIRDFKFIRVNQVLLRMYLEEDPTGRTYLETTKYGVEMGMFDGLKKVMETGEPLDEEFYFDREGYHHWFRVTARAQNDLLITGIEDISKRKAEAEELQENLRFRQELGRTSQETILIISLSNFNVKYCNRDLFPEAGITRERVQGTHLVEILPFIHPRDREKLLHLHKRLLKSSLEEIHETEVRVKLSEDSWEWFNVRGKIYFRRDPSWVEEYVLLLTNISTQKKTEKALLSAEKLSIQGEVARILAHELRNPISSIGMVGEVLSSRLKVSEEKELSKFIDILSRSAKRLNMLVTDLLTSSNYSPVDLKKEDLAVIMERSIENAADRIYLAGIELEKDFEGPYPVLADKEKLEIVFVNILVNASEATVPGQGKIRIAISEEKHEYIVAITDNGLGMEQEQVDRLFDAFYTNKPNGLGVGLSSVKTILEEHDAHISVLSKPQEGATFKMFFRKA